MRTNVSGMYIAPLRDGSLSEIGELSLKTGGQLHVHMYAIGVDDSDVTHEDALYLAKLIIRNSDEWMVVLREDWEEAARLIAGMEEQ